MTDSSNYPIGTPGKKWGDAERQQWLDAQSVKRRYQDQVLDALSQLPEGFQCVQYGALSYNPARYPLFAVQPERWDSKKLTALVTGGVHGYETSGVQGALRFIQTKAPAYADRFNLVVAPCISPWAYETINRWNPYAVDPNRSFVTDSPAEESAALMAYIESLDCTFDLHTDLHETTDTDNSEFRPALAARDNVTHKIWDIPDGFYLVGDSENPQHELQGHIIQAVSKVTHIAPADADGRIIGEPITQTGVINYPVKALGLCTGLTTAAFGTTTEVYPDSPKVDDENCILAQVAAVTSALDYVAAKLAE